MPHYICTKVVIVLQVSKMDSLNSSCTQTHNFGSMGITANFIFPLFFQFSSLFLPNDIGKCEIGNQGVLEDCISRLHILLNLFIFDGRVKTKLSMMAFLYWGEFVKNSIE